MITVKKNTKPVDEGEIGCVTTVCFKEKRGFFSLAGILGSVSKFLYSNKQSVDYMVLYQFKLHFCFALFHRFKEYNSV